MKIEHLPWDTNFFSKKTGKVLIEKGDEDIAKLIDHIIDRAAKEKYQLLYIFSNKHIDEISNDKLVLKLTDKKIVYTIDVSGIKLTAMENCEKIVHEYTESKITPDLERLAYLSGYYSRFCRDDMFDENDFCRLFKTWLQNSLSGEIADKVFTTTDLDKITGFITLKYNNDTGHIGLIAVDESTQRKGYGKMLIQKCLIDLAKKKIGTMSVTTQLANKAACDFYVKCGFKKHSLTDVYHLWVMP